MDHFGAQESSPPLPTPTDSDVPEVPMLGFMRRMLQNPIRAIEHVAGEHRGKIVPLRFGPVTAHLVTDPAHLQHVLVTNVRNYPKGEAIWRAARGLLGYGLVTSDGDLWGRQRRILQPLFTARYTARLAETMRGIINDELDNLESQVARGAVFELDGMMMNITQRVNLTSIFGTRIGRGESDQISEAILAALHALRYRIFFFFLPEWFPFPGKSRLRAALKTIDDAVYSWVRQRRQGGLGQEDLISLALAAREEGEVSDMNDQQARDELVTMLVAGNESTAATMTWFWYLLACHPETTQRVREEIATVLGGQPPTGEKAEKLIHTRQVLNEALRLYPPAWILSRIAASDDNIQGHRIPKGDIILFSPYVTHRDPRFWPEPERFDPDRFTPDLVKQRHRCAFIPFGAGPRQCIGLHFAMLEGLLIASLMMQRFRPHLAPGQHVEPYSAGTLRPHRKIQMILDPIAN